MMFYIQVFSFLYLVLTVNCKKLFDPKGAHSASIVGGVPTKLQKFPFNVQIYNVGSLCGGVILSRKIVITAAHCFDYNRILADIMVLSNTRYIYDSKSQKHKVWALRIHERYNATAAFENDLALIIIANSFKYGESVQKAALCSSNVWMRVNEKFLVAGWGETEFGEGVHDQVLRMAYMEFVTRESCMKANKAHLTEDMFCLFGDGVRDACRGDSGGGVFWNNMLVGIVSHGKGCAWAPSMFVNLHKLRPWIIRNVNEMYSTFCNYVHKNKPKQKG